MSERNAAPHCMAAMLVSKPDTAQLGHGRSSAHRVISLLGSWLVSQLHWSSTQDIIRAFVVVAAFGFVLWAHLCHYYKSETWRLLTMGKTITWP